MDHIEIWSDGSCEPNPGVGGWGVIWVIGDDTIERCGGLLRTTNNRMEIMGVLIGLERLSDPYAVTVRSDSMYVVNAINSWLERWERYGWRRHRNGKGSIKNLDLWLRMAVQLQRHDVRARHVRGHVGIVMNERADRLAATGRLKATRFDSGYVAG